MDDTEQNFALLTGSSGVWERARWTYGITGEITEELRLIIERDAQANNLDFETYLNILKKVAKDPYDESKWQEGRKPPRDWGATKSSAQEFLKFVGFIAALMAPVIIGSIVGYHVGFSMIGSHLSQTDSALSLGAVGGMCGLMIDIVGLLMLYG